MASHRLDNYLRSYRKRSGLTQREVALLLGWKNGAQLSRYEKRHRLPPLRTALACEAIYKIPVAELFAGVHHSVNRQILIRINTLVADLREKPDTGRQRLLTARKLSWISDNHSGALSATT